MNYEQTSGSTKIKADLDEDRLFIQSVIEYEKYYFWNLDGVLSTRLYTC